MRRSRKESKLMDKAILELFEELPEARKVENRYRALRSLLIEKYPKLAEFEKDVLCKILFDTVTLDRKIRLWTQGEQQELKQELSDQFIINEL